MSQRRQRLRVAKELQAIECARRTAAQVALADARRAVADAQRDQNEAQGAAAEADSEWRAHMAKGYLDPAINRLFAGELLARERAHDAARHQTEEAESRSDRRLQEWIELEASVRSGERLITRWGREARRKRNDALDRELADRTSRKWFDR